MKICPLGAEFFEHVYNVDWRSLFFSPVTVCCAVVRLFQVISKRMTMKKPLNNV